MKKGSAAPKVYAGKTPSAEPATTRELTFLKGVQTVDLLTRIVNEANIEYFTVRVTIRNAQRCRYRRLFMV